VTVPSVELHVVSDATGETAARLVQALEAQFPDQEFVEIRHPRVESEEDLHLAVNRMKGRPAVVVYTLVKPELRDAMRTLCRRARLHYCDLLGQPIDAVARVSGVAAKMTPGSRPPLNSAYFKRMEAIEFAVRFDDGVGRGLHDADVVLVGVSRTSKTPLSIYLGYLGHKAANVPVVKGIEPPADLFTVDQRKIVGLTIDPNRLVEIRRARARTMGARSRQYAELIEIYLTELTEVVERDRGVVFQYTGDGLLALFLPELAGVDGAVLLDRLVNHTSPALHGVFDNLYAGWRTEWRQSGRPVVEIGLGAGLSFGRATIGFIGPSGKKQFGALGEPVNLAAFLGSEAGPGTSLVDCGSFRRAGAAGSTSLTRAVRAPLATSRTGPPSRPVMSAGSAAPAFTTP